MKLELIQPIFGDSAGHLALRSGSSLSWSEHYALKDTAAASMATAQQVAFARQTLEQLRYDVQDVTQAVETLQTEIGLQLQEQTRLMSRQVELLAKIAETLRTPARTRAAERISDAGELLSRERYERALTVAMQAVDDDPNNPAGFLAVAWASLGVDNVEQARVFFREAAQASDGDQRQSARRQAARLTFLLEGPQAALKELGDTPEQLSPKEEGATDYDRAVYFSNAGESATAADYIRKASYHNGRFCLMALTDPILSREATVVQTAAEQLRTIQEEADSIAAEYHRGHARYEALCKEIDDLGLTEAVWKWRERRDDQWRRTLQNNVPHLDYAGLNALSRARANAGFAHEAVDQDEQALVERRAEEVLNDALAREAAKGWSVMRRTKLEALICTEKENRWRGGFKSQCKEVGLDRSGKVILTKVERRNEGWTVSPTPLPEDKQHRVAAFSCEYCWCLKLVERGVWWCPACDAGELELFLNERLKSFRL